MKGASVKAGGERRGFSSALTAGLAYFGLVFGSGFVLGTIRVLFVAPRVGERAAELLEAPLMLAVMTLAAGWVVRRIRVPAGAGVRAAVGGLALALVTLLDFTAVLWLRGLTLADYFRQRDPVAASVYFIMLLVFAAMPLIVGRRPEAAGARMR